MTVEHFSGKQVGRLGSPVRGCEIVLEAFLRGGPCQIP